MVPQGKTAREQHAQENQASYAQQQAAVFMILREFSRLSVLHLGSFFHLCKVYNTIFPVETATGTFYEKI